ncbi:hypothetical protein RUND412_001866 [Rhizina undulata]
MSPTTATMAASVAATTTTTTNASPPRAGRPSHPRPTTYTGLSPSTPASNSPPAPPPHSHSNNNSVSNPGPPIAPPPRTSSQRHAPSAGDAASPPDRSRSTGSRRQREQSADGRDRERSERDRERERADRERRREDESRSRREQPVGRSNSARESSSRNGTQHSSPQVDGSSNTRRRQDDGSSSSSKARVAAGNSTGGLAVVNNPDGHGRSTGNSRKETKFGDYILGQTLGEGEFGKVKLGWRKDGGVQVAIKLIRRDSLSPHPNRLSKIYREISILRTLSHPNIVRLHEMVETERHIGIILEYASGGELFDYILTHRYLKDPPACRLFAQLVSGVGYLHKKGIVHRDLKLENLLLDRNRNIIITDFGFANVFDPRDELGELEDRLDEPGILKELEKGVPNDGKDDNGSLLSILGPGQVRRRGDLMATSCGSPCYAAPELVVSDGLYTGRKVDVWSCGVILYAMLAGYLPFDDDPANPEGDNINLLYKYIVSTPLTFPEYVSPHARDLLRRILVPDPRKRADLFEVARHSWLSPFANVVSLITSATTGVSDVETVTVNDVHNPDAPMLTRSASVREPPTVNTHSRADAHGGMGTRHYPHEHSTQPTQQRTTSDAKRRTVQVEYVEPTSQTKRGSAVDPDSHATVNVARTRSAEAEDAAPPPVVPTGKPDGLARAATTAGTSFFGGDKGRPGSRPGTASKARPISYQYQSTPPSSSRPMDGTASTAPSRRPSRDRSGPPVSSKYIPGQETASGQRPDTANSTASQRLPSRGSYNKPVVPVAPGVSANNAQGRIAMPKGGKPYTISNPIPQPDNTAAIGTGEMGKPPISALPSKFKSSQMDHVKGHKRANTVGGGTGGESGRFLGKFMGGAEPKETVRPTMSGAGEPRQSFDQSIRPAKFEKPQKGRRFSLLPTSFSLRSMSGDGHKHERRPSRSASNKYFHSKEAQPQTSSYPQLAVPGSAEGRESVNTGSDTSLAVGSAPASASGVPTDRKSPDIVSTNSATNVNANGAAPKRTGVLQKNRKFTEAYEGGDGGSGGSSGPARRVMDFFRRRGVNRSKGA